MTRVKNPQDFWAGLLFLVVGIGAGLDRPGVYTFGTATKMGPGYLADGSELGSRGRWASS